MKILRKADMLEKEQVRYKKFYDLPTQTAKRRLDLGGPTTCGSRRKQVDARRTVVAIHGGAAVDVFRLIL